MDMAAEAKALLPSRQCERPALPYSQRTRPSTHREDHFKDSALLQNICVGLADGLTVPFALAAGLTGLFAESHVVILAVLAELTAGGISMGLGGYLAGLTEVQHYDSERKVEESEVEYQPEVEEAEIVEILSKYGLTETQVAPILQHFRNNPTQWVDFMMEFEIGLREPDRAAPGKTALTIGLSYVVGGIVPLIPFLFIPLAKDAIRVSVVFSSAALFAFGAAKASFLRQNKFLEGMRTMGVGLVAAFAAYLVSTLSSGQVA